MNIVTLYLCISSSHFIDALDSEYSDEIKLGFKREDYFDWISSESIDKTKYIFTFDKLSYTYKRSSTSDNDRFYEFDLRKLRAKELNRNKDVMSFYDLTHNIGLKGGSNFNHYSVGESIFLKNETNSSEICSSVFRNMIVSYSMIMNSDDTSTTYNELNIYIKSVNCRISSIKNKVIISNVIFLLDENTKVVIGINESKINIKNKDPSALIEISSNVSEISINNMYKTMHINAIDSLVYLSGANFDVISRGNNQLYSCNLCEYMNVRCSVYDMLKSNITSFSYLKLFHSAAFDFLVSKIDIDNLYIENCTYTNYTDSLHFDVDNLTLKRSTLIGKSYFTLNQLNYIITVENACFFSLDYCPKIINLYLSDDIIGSDSIIIQSGGFITIGRFKGECSPVINEFWRQNEYDITFSYKLQDSSLKILFYQSNMKKIAKNVLESFNNFTDECTNLQNNTIIDFINSSVIMNESITVTASNNSTFCFSFEDDTRVIFNRYCNFLGNIVIFGSNLKYANLNVRCKQSFNSSDTSIWLFASTIEISCVSSYIPIVPINFQYLTAPGATFTRAIPSPLSVIYDEPLTIKELVIYHRKMEIVMNESRLHNLIFTYNSSNVTIMNAKFLGTNINISGNNTLNVVKSDFSNVKDLNVMLDIFSSGDFTSGLLSVDEFYPFNVNLIWSIENGSIPYSQVSVGSIIYTSKSQMKSSNFRALPESYTRDSCLMKPMIFLSPTINSLIAEVNFYRISTLIILTVSFLSASVILFFIWRVFLLVKRCTSRKMDHERLI